MLSICDCLGPWLNLSPSGSISLRQVDVACLSLGKGQQSTRGPGNESGEAEAVSSCRILAHFRDS